MTKYDTELPQVVLLFAAAEAEATLRKHTETLHSPHKCPDSKAKAANGVYEELTKHNSGLQIDIVTVVDAAAATLRHVPYGSEQEFKALGVIAKNLNELPSEKAVDAAYAAAHHTHFLGWYGAMHTAGVKPSDAAQETRRELERTAVNNWAAQMQRLTPETWEKKQKEFSHTTQTMSLLERTARNLQKPLAATEPIAERPDPQTPHSHRVLAA